MASNPGTARKNGALSAFTSVSPLIKVYRAPQRKKQDSKPSNVADPKLILVCAWMDAIDAHIAKYVNKHMKMYPTSDIVVLKRPFMHTLPSQTSRAAMKPVPDLIRELLPNASTKKPEMLIHFFSNGGTSSLRDTAEHWAQSAPSGSPTHLPLHISIFDSAPGTMTTMGNIRATQTGMKPAWLQTAIIPLLLILNAITFFWYGYIDPPSPIERSNIAMNDRDKMREVRRAYMYSKQDPMVRWQDVEAHAADARRKGFEVRTERWEKGGHVALVRVDEERYWEIVRETWQGP